MNERGLYQCTECENRVYHGEGEGDVGGCRQCGSELRKISVPTKGWLGE